MQQLDLLVGPKQPAAINNWDKEELTSQLSDLCDSLLAEGFQWQDVQEALQVTRLHCHIILAISASYVLQSGSTARML